MPLKILIVDDEQVIIDVLKARLIASGYEVCSATDGLEAIEKVKSEKPNLIIMDVLMPRMTGYEAMEKIRENPASCMIPALVVSAKGSMRDYFSGITGVEFIAKPFDAKELMARIEVLTGGKPATQGGSRRLILVGVEDFLIGKIRSLFTSLNYQILVALNEEDAFEMSQKLRPDFILCQYWEEETVLDAKKLCGKLAEHATLVHVPLYVYCKETLAIEAMKTFKGDRLITFSDSADLVKKLTLFLTQLPPH